MTEMGNFIQQCLSLREQKNKDAISILRKQSETTSCFVAVSEETGNVFKSKDALLESINRMIDGRDYSFSLPDYCFDNPDYFITQFDGIPFAVIGECFFVNLHLN